MAKIEHIKNKRGEVIYPVSKEGAIYDENGVLLSTKIATFTTRLANNLANYYLKSETYTKEEVNNLIGTIQSFAYIVVSELPTASALTEGIIYLVPSEDPQTQNVKDEYITIRSGVEGSYTYSWEQIGSTAIDLSGYVTTEALNNALADYTTTANLTTLLAAKQDTIADLSTIRSGAAAGATAYQKPGTGIPATDMASGVQTSLGKADSAYQKPSGGIPKTDLESSVQGSLELADTAVQAEPIGSIVPPVDPSEFATKEEVEELEAKVDDLQTGKYYGHYGTEEELPEGDVPGYAYVGEDPSAIYDFVNGEWRDSGQTVNQSPIGNDEDIDQNEAGKLQFANRVYNAQQPNGMGYKILRKDATFSSQVTDTNTIYEIRYNFNLGGASVSIPARSVLYFNGGSINNGAVNFNNAKIESESPCFDGITPTGLHVISAEWFGITPESADISTKFNALCASFTERETIKFKPEVYQTSATLVFNHTGSYAENREFSIVGNPIFLCNTANITCVSLTGVNMGKLEFRVHRAYPAKWGDNGSIGVLLVNVLRTTIKISEIKYFTYGLICRADGDGFAWNNLYVPHIYCALQSFVVECVNGGWPNANNVTGGIGGARNSGLWDESGATEPIRTIVFKTDGTYAPNGWNFDGLWIEANAGSSPAIGGKDYVPIDLSDYCSSIDGTAQRFIDMNFSGRFEVHTPIIKVRRSSIARKLNLVGYNIGSGNHVAIDENGGDVTGSVVSVIGYESTHIFLDRVEYNSQDDIIGSPRIPSGKSYLGGLLYGKMNLCYGQFGYTNKNAVFSIVGGVQILIKRRTYCSIDVIFFDGEMQHIHPDDALWKPVGYPNSLRVNAPSGSSYRPYLTNNDGTTDETFLLLSNSPVKYVAIGADSRGDIEIYQVKGPRVNTPICKKAFPFGIGDVNTHYGNDAITSLRCWVKEGQIYVDNTGKMYKFIRPGSLGTTTITASGNAGENFITASETSSLFVGDYITIGSEKFRIVAINTTTKVLTLDGTLASNHTGEQISFTQPTYSQILPNNVATTSGRPTLTSADAGTMCFDKTLSKPVWWTGTGWVDATGATV